MDNPWKVLCIVFITLFCISFVINIAGGFSSVAGSALFSKTAGPDARAQEAVSYIRANLISSGESISLLNVTEESGVYRIATAFSSSGGNRTIDVFMTKDGKMLFPAWYPLDSATTTTPAAAAPVATTASAAKTCADLSKRDAPVLEAFVVSYCPYGRQMQSILANITESLPILTPYIKVRYIGGISNGTVQSMHGPTEAAENLRQICIREEQPDRYWKYVSCFLNSSSSDTCLESAGVNTTTLTACADNATRGLRYAEKDFALSDSYGVQGSPTLVLNGQTVSEFDFGGRTPEAVKSLLCCGFASRPGACAITLSGTSDTAQGNCG